MNEARRPPTIRQFRGWRAERRACRHLQQHGLRLVDRNFRSRNGEIDLIMRDGDTLVFVEVRYRNTTAFGGALASVDHRKQEKLRAAARAYIQRHPAVAEQAMRFDIVGIDGRDGPPEWLKNAF